MTAAEKAFYIEFPPTDVAGTDGHQVVQTDTNAGAAKNSDLWTTLKTAGYKPEGKVWVTFEAVGATMYVRFKKTNSAAATTADNGMAITVGVPKRYYLDPMKHKYIDTLGTGAGSIKWYVSSPPMELNRMHDTTE